MRGVRVQGFRVARALRDLKGLCGSLEGFRVKGLGDCLKGMLNKSHLCIKMCKA